MICIQGAAAVTHFRCLNFSPALNFVLSLLVVRLILSRRDIPEAHDFEAFRRRAYGCRAASARISVHPGFSISGSRRMRITGATVSRCGRDLLPNFLSPSMRCDKPLLETINSHANSRFELDRLCQEAIQAHLAAPAKHNRRYAPLLKHCSKC